MSEREEWLASRLHVVGASESACLFDAQPPYALSRYALWMVKSGRAPAPDVDNQRVRWGLRLEPYIAECIAEENGWTLTKGTHVRSPITPGMGCTLDYTIVADPQEEGPGALEIKNVDWMVHRRSWTDDEPPLHILIQHQHQLAVTGYTWGAVGAFIGGNEMRIYRYKARPKLIADIRRRVIEFWASIADGKAPPVDGSDSASAVLRSLYGEVVDDAIDMSASNEWPEAVGEFIAAGERRKAANEDYDAAKNRVVALLGGHKRAYGAGYSVNTAVTAATPDRPARPDEIIKGRSEVRRYTAKFTEAA